MEKSVTFRTHIKRPGHKKNKYEKKKRDGGLEQSTYNNGRDAELGYSMH